MEQYLWIALVLVWVAWRLLRGGGGG
jgi:hypothetical protein